MTLLNILIAVFIFGFIVYAAGVTINPNLISNIYNVILMSAVNMGDYYVALSMVNDIPQ